MHLFFRLVLIIFIIIISSSLSSLFLRSSWACRKATVSRLSSNPQTNRKKGTNVFNLLLQRMSLTTTKDQRTLPSLPVDKMTLRCIAGLRYQRHRWYYTLNILPLTYIRGTEKKIDESTCIKSTLAQIFRARGHSWMWISHMCRNAWSPSAAQ